MRAGQDAQLRALQESAAALLTVSEASGAEGAALCSEIGWLEAVLSEAAAEHASGNTVAVGQEQQQQQLPQAACPSTNVAVCALRELPPPVQATQWHNPLFSQLPTVGIELFVLLPAPGVEPWTKGAKQKKKWRHRY